MFDKWSLSFVKFDPNWNSKYFTSYSIFYLDKGSKQIVRVDFWLESMLATSPNYNKSGKRVHLTQDNSAEINYAFRALLTHGTGQLYAGGHIQKTVALVDTLTPLIALFDPVTGTSS